MCERVALGLSRSTGHFALMLAEDFTIEWASDTAYALFGHDDCVGRNALEYLHPDDIGIALEGLEHHSNNAEFYARGFEPMWRPDIATVRIAHADGTWVDTAVNLLNFLHDPEVGGFMVLGSRTRDTSDLPRVIDMLGSGANLTDVLPVIARLVDLTVDTLRCQIVWWDGNDDHVVTAPDSAPLPMVPPELIGRVRRTREMTEMHLDEDQRAALGRDSAWIRTVAVLPITTPSGDTVIGCLVMWSPLPSDFVLAPQLSVHQAVSLATLALVDHHTKAALAWEAGHDPLTALVNRSGFRSVMNAADQRSSVLFVDLDGFKDVNDAFGHDLGDEVLVEVATRISRAVRQGDVVGSLRR